MNRQIKSVLYLSVLAGMAAVLVLFACDDKKPTEPKPVVPKDYVVYMADANAPDIYGYHSVTDILDSFSIPFQVDFSLLTVSPDGSNLYAHSTDSIYEIDTRDFSVKPFWPEIAWIAFSYDGELVAIQGGDLNIFRTSDMSLVFQDTSAVISGSFSRDGKEFFGLSAPGTRLPDQLYHLRLDSGNIVTRKTITEFHPWQLIVSQDGGQFFTYSVINNCTFVFQVFDVAQDTIVFEDFLIPGYGRMRSSPDGRYIAYTNPGPIPTSCPSSTYDIIVYDIANRSILRHIPISGRFRGDTTLIPLPIQNLSFTPDGRWLIGTVQAPFFVIINVDTWEIERFGDAGNWQGLFSPASQMMP